MGHVYVIRVGKLCKIGLSSHVLARFDAISSEIVIRPIQLLCTFKTSRMYGLERALHTYLKKWRKHGEWFSLPEEIILDLIDLSILPESMLVTHDMFWPNRKKA